jgi:hypothetical protein
MPAVSGGSVFLIRYNLPTLHDTRNEQILITQKTDKDWMKWDFCIPSYNINCTILFLIYNEIYGEKGWNKLEIFLSIFWCVTVFGRHLANIIYMGRNRNNMWRLVNAWKLRKFRLVENIKWPINQGLSLWRMYILFFQSNPCIYSFIM